jgi:hypothetical protein
MESRRPLKNILPKTSPTNVIQFLVQRELILIDGQTMVSTLKRYMMPKLLHNHYHFILYGFSKQSYLHYFAGKGRVKISPITKKREGKKVKRSIVHHTWKENEPIYHKPIEELQGTNGFPFLDFNKRDNYWCYFMKDGKTKISLSQLRVSYLEEDCELKIAFWFNAYRYNEIFEFWESV